MRIFMTGATGVVGRRLIPLLRARGDDVTAVVHSEARVAELSRCGARPVAVNIFDSRAVREEMAGHDAVVNLATHMPPSVLHMFLPGAWRENDDLRTTASALLVDAALSLGIPRFVQESFALTYADHGDDWIDEGAPLEPARQGRSVVDAEHAVAQFIAEGCVGVVLRFATFYGPDSRMLADLIRVVEHGWSPLPGAADAFISSVSHDDAATAALAALVLPPGAYNVVDDQPLLHREFVDSLADALGVPHPRMLPASFAKLAGSLARTLARSLRISNRKLRSAGWAPRYRSVRDAWPHVVGRRSRPAPTPSRHPGEAGV